MCYNRSVWSGNINLSSFTPNPEAKNPFASGLKRFLLTWPFPSFDVFGVFCIFNTGCLLGGKHPQMLDEFLGVSFPALYGPDQLLQLDHKLVPAYLLLLQERLGFNPNIEESIHEHVASGYVCPPG